MRPFCKLLWAVVSVVCVCCRRSCRWGPVIVWWCSVSRTSTASTTPSWLTAAGEATCPQTISSPPPPPPGRPRPGRRRPTGRGRRPATRPPRHTAAAAATRRRWVRRRRRRRRGITRRTTRRRRRAQRPLDAATRLATTTRPPRRRSRVAAGPRCRAPGRPLSWRRPATLAVRAATAAGSTVPWRDIAVDSSATATGHLLSGHPLPRGRCSRSAVLPPTAHWQWTVAAPDQLSLAALI